MYEIFADGHSALISESRQTRLGLWVPNVTFNKRKQEYL